MEFRALLLDQHARAHTAAVGGVELSLQDTLLRDIPAALVRRRLPGGFNSLAWLLWHMTRTEDIGINVVIARLPQVLDRGGWASRLAVVRRDLGTGMTDAEVEAFDRQIVLTALLAYRAAVGRHTQQIVRDLHPAVLDEVIDGAVLQQAREQGAFGPHAAWVRLLPLRRANPDGVDTRSIP